MELNIKDTCFTLVDLGNVGHVWLETDAGYTEDQVAEDIQNGNTYDVLKVIKICSDGVVMDVTLDIAEKLALIPALQFSDSALEFCVAMKTIDADWLDGGESRYERHERRERSDYEEHNIMNHLQQGISR